MSKVIGKDGEGTTRCIFSDLDDVRSVGLLWYVNRVAFHPLGMALAFNVDDDGTESIQVVGNQTSPWSFDEKVDDKMFALWQDFLARMKAGTDDPAGRGNEDASSPEAVIEQLRQDCLAEEQE